MKIYGLFNDAGEMVSGVYPVTAKNKFEALISICHIRNRGGHRQAGFVTDGDKIYEYDSEYYYWCGKDFPKFNPDVDPYLNPDKYDIEKFRDEYCYNCYNDSFSVDPCYTLTKNDENVFEDPEIGYYKNEEDARRAARKFFLDDSEFTIIDPKGNKVEQEQVANE